LSDEQDVNEQVRIITQALIKAEQRCIPSKVTRLKGQKWKVYPEVLKLLQQSKDLYKQWTCIGKPSVHPLRTQLKLEKSI
jgi:hypothetical protein